MKIGFENKFSLDEGKTAEDMLAELFFPYLDTARLAFDLLEDPTSPAWEIYGGYLPDYILIEVHAEIEDIFVGFLTKGDYSNTMAMLYEGPHRRDVLHMLMGWGKIDIAKQIETAFSDLDSFLAGESTNPGMGYHLLKNLSLTKEQVRHCLAHCCEDDSLRIGQLRLLFEDEDEEV